MRPMGIGKKPPCYTDPCMTETEEVDRGALPGGLQQLAVLWSALDS